VNEPIETLHYVFLVTHFGDDGDVITLTSHDHVLFLMWSQQLHVDNYNTGSYS